MKLTSLIKERYFEPKGTPGTRAKDIKMKTKIKQNVFGSWIVMYSEKENIFDYKDFSTQEEAQEYEQKLKTK